MNKLKYFILFVHFFFTVCALPSSIDSRKLLKTENITEVENSRFNYGADIENQLQNSTTETYEPFEFLNWTTVEYENNIYDYNNVSDDIASIQYNDSVVFSHEKNTHDDLIKTDHSPFESVNKFARNFISDLFSTLWNLFRSLFGQKLPRKNPNSKADNNSINISNSELAEISEILLDLDVNNVKEYVSTNTQMKIRNSSKEDFASEPLLGVNNAVWNTPTISAMKELYDNYEQDVRIDENVTAQEKSEESVFLDIIMKTPVMRRLIDFFIAKGILSSNKKQQKEIFSNVWFGLYPRTRGKISSSGFEHVFLSEIKKNKISGLHNWLYFHTEETAQRANYFGYIKKIDLGTKGAILKFAFNLKGIYKPVTSMFIGTSPELEIALYSLCFFTRADKKCPIFLNGQKINMRTHTYRYEGNNMIGSAFPEI